MTSEAATRLLHLADDLRAVGTNGLHWTTDVHDRDRYERALAIAAELASMVDTRKADEIERVFRGDLGRRTPLVAVDAAIFDESGRILLIQRADNAQWAMPGGAAEVGEMPSEAIAREVREETKLDVVATRLIGVYDARRVGSPDPVHLYHLGFLCDVIGGSATCTPEARAIAFVTEPEALDRPLHPGHGPHIRDAFRILREQLLPTIFD